MCMSSIFLMPPPFIKETHIKPWHGITCYPLRDRRLSYGAASSMASGRISFSPCGSLIPLLPSARGRLPCRAHPAYAGSPDFPSIVAYGGHLHLMVAVRDVFMVRNILDYAEAPLQALRELVRSGFQGGPVDRV